MSRIFNWFDSYMERNGRKRIIMSREGNKEYMIRYYLFRKRFDKNNEQNEDSNLFLHKIVMSDEDENCHNHPWSFKTFILKGVYDEEILDKTTLSTRIIRRTRWVQRNYSENHFHRLILVDNKPVWTLFWHGKRKQDWGFYTQDGFVNWMEYLDEEIGDN